MQVQDSSSTYFRLIPFRHNFSILKFGHNYLIILVQKVSTVQVVFWGENGNTLCFNKHVFSQFDYRNYLDTKEDLCKF